MRNLTPSEVNSFAHFYTKYYAKWEPNQLYWLLDLWSQKDLVLDLTFAHKHVNTQVTSLTLAFLIFKLETVMHTQQDVKIKWNNA